MATYNVCMSGVPSVLLGVLPLLILIGLVVGIRIAIRIFFRRRKPAVTFDRCKCGYVIEKLSTGRCPECGRVFGFDATAEELGLTTEQLERSQAMRLQRKNRAASLTPPSLSSIVNQSEAKQD